MYVRSNELSNTPDIHEPHTPAMQAPRLCIVVPTFNEKENVGEVVARVRAVMGDTPWEIIVADDNSADDTVGAVRALARTDPRVRFIRRVGRRGLSSACIEGMLATAAPVVAVMDADLQHDETLLPKMIEVLDTDPAVDVVVGSRYVQGGGFGEWDATRVRTSQVATRLARMITSTDVADPMSGFFMLRTSIVHEVVPRLSGIGFKILLDILASMSRPPVCVELPYEFRDRRAGESKLDNRVIWDYLMLLGDKTIGRYVPIRFVSFAIVGSLGVLVHLIVLTIVFRQLNMPFAWAQGTATLAAMTFNFLLNNMLTYRDRQLHGLGLLRGWATFVAACSLGAAGNVGIASYLFAQDTYWVLSAMAGIVVGVVWNYAVTAAYTWRVVK